MKPYTTQEIAVMYNNCNSIDDILHLTDTLKWLWANGADITYKFIRETAVKRTREII